VLPKRPKYLRQETAIARQRVPTMRREEKRDIRNKYQGNANELVETYFTGKIYK
jgi:hypothetical protein